MAFETVSGIITNIQRFSLDDGPGTRTTVFFKGCSIACKWCHNPETISSKIQIQYQEKACKNCGACVSVCSSGAQSIKDGKHVLDWQACNQCLICADACSFGALSVIGRKITAQELGEQLLRDRIFYKRSGGGVTLSGGEPLLQADFAAAVLLFLKENGIHTALDTAGNIPWKLYEKVLPLLDLILFDIKIIDADKHKKMTGVRNDLILENFRNLLKENVAIWVRTPLIKKINDDDDETNRRIKLLVSANNVQKKEILPFHRYGLGKYASLGMEACEFESPEKETLEHIKSLMETAGLENVIIP
jgi:pyruvate formate lyase activating enzyme